ncbi:MAG: type II secretion system protein GspD, partial [Syntrophus sp. (in: bacteria)]|nr:type II secretion system protein GspD [Syntrophus sp. (in: bacteria)]
MKPAAGQAAAPAESTPDPGFRRRMPKTQPGSVAAPAVQSTPASPHKAAASAPLPSKSAASGQESSYVTIDFDNVDIQVFIKFVSELTGRNFVIDDKVKGKVTVISPNKISVAEVYKVFESVLEIYGFATVDAGDVTKVILAQEARGKNVDLRVKPEAVDPEDKIVTQILSLQHASPDEMKKILDPLISKNSII